MNIARAAPHPLCAAIKVKVAGAQMIGHSFWATAAQQRVNSRHQFWDRERLDDIVIGADL
jgi:hypothetical protein